MACVGHLTFETVSNFLYIYIIFLYIVRKHTNTFPWGGMDKENVTLSSIFMVKIMSYSELGFFFKKRIPDP